MTIHKLSNPHNFVKECRSKGIVYDELLEAITCIGQQKVCEMFEGKSNRGGTNNISAGTIQNWLATFEFAYANPDIEDNDPFQSRTIEKKGDLYDQYVKLIRTRIDEETFKSWETLSNRKLGDEAIRYGLTLGIRNAKSIMNLRERMKEMWNRRKRKFWDKSVNDDATTTTNHDVPEETINYKMNNIITLRHMAKERGIVFHQKSKDEIIQLLEAYDQKKKDGEDPPTLMDYEKMSSRQLKDLAKTRGFNQYNNMNNTNLRSMHKQYDEAMSKKQEEDTPPNIEQTEEHEVKEFQLVHENGDTFPILIREDGMVNATLLCKAGGKKFAHYQRNEQTQAFIEALKSDMQYRNTQLIIIKQGNTSKFVQGTWCHRLIAIDCARWLNPRFALQIIKWTDEIITKGFVKIEKPLLPILDRTDMDVQAEELEMQCNPLHYSNQFVLYVAYIGKGLVKIGSSDCRIHERESKHLSCESLYPQFRFIGIFPISSGCIEKTIHHLLEKYRFPFEKQKEVYKPPSGELQDFLEMIRKMLEEHDLKYQLMEKNRMILQLEKENLDLRNKILQLSSTE